MQEGSQEMQQGRDTTQGNITAFFQGTSSQTASSSKESAPAKKQRAKPAVSAKKQRAKTAGSPKKGRSRQSQKTQATAASPKPKKEKKGKHAQLSSSAAHARSQWEAKGSKRKLARTPSAIQEEIDASTKPPEIQHASSHPRAARSIAEVFDTLNVNAQFLNGAYPQMGERVTRNVAELDFYTDFSGPDMAALGHMGPNNFTR